MSKNHKIKITEKVSKKCAPKDLFTFASDDIIPGKHTSVLTDDSCENTEFK